MSTFGSADHMGVLSSSLVMDRVFHNWRTSLAGVLTAVSTAGAAVTAVLASQDPQGANSKLAFWVTIVVAICRAFLGLVQKDAK